MNYLAPVLGLLGLDQQYNANQESKNQAQAQLALQQQEEQAQLGARTNYLDQVGDLQQQGAFNPAARLQALGQQGQYDITNALSSEAGAARALGYRPGDTVPVTEMNQTMGNYNLEQEQLANQITNQANANYLSAIQGAPSLSDLGAGIGAGSENARTLYGQESGSGGLLSSLSPYLNSLGNAGNNGSAAPFNPYVQQANDGYGAGGYDSYNPELNTGTTVMGDGGYPIGSLPSAPMSIPAAPQVAPNAAANPVSNGAYTAPILGPGGEAMAPSSVNVAPGQAPSTAIQSIGVIPQAPTSPYGPYATPPAPGQTQNGLPQATPATRALGDSTAQNGGMGGNLQRPRMSGYQMPAVYNL